MSVRTFCGATAQSAIVNPSTGNWMVGDIGTAWDSRHGGNQYTSLRDENGVTIVDGLLESFLPGFCQAFQIDQDPPVEGVWLDFGGDERTYVECNDRASFRVAKDSIGEPNGVAGLDGAGQVAQPISVERVIGLDGVIADAIGSVGGGTDGGGVSTGDSVSIFSFGVVGDGVTNDRLGVQAFFDYLAAHGGRGVAYNPDKPEPTFLCSPYNVTIDSNAHGFTFDGGGCTFKFSGPGTTPSNGISLHNAANVKMRNFTIDGGGPTITNHPLVGYKVRNCTFEEIVVRNYGGTGGLCYEEIADLGGNQTYRNHFIRCVAFGNGTGNNGFSHVQSIGSTIVDCQVFALNTAGTANPGYGLQLKNTCTGCRISGGYVDTAVAGVAFGFTNQVAAKNNVVSGVMVKNCITGFLGSWMDGNSVDMDIQMISSASTYAVRLQAGAVHNNIRVRVAAPPATSTIARIGDNDNRLHIELINALGSAGLVAFDTGTSDNLVIVGSISDKGDSQLTGLPVSNSGAVTNKILFERLLG